MQRTRVVRFLRLTFSILFITALITAVFGVAIWRRMGKQDTREVRFRLLPVSEWGFGKELRVPVPLVPAPPNTPTASSSPPPGVGRFGMTAYLYRPGRMRLFRIMLAEDAEKAEAQQRLATRGSGANQRFLPGAIALLNSGVSGKTINLYMPQPPSGRLPTPKPSPGAGGAPQVQAGIYWPFSFPRLPHAPGPYPSPTPTSAPTPRPNRPNTRTITRVVAGPNGSRRTVTYTITVNSGPQPAPNAPGFVSFPSSNGMAVPEPMLNQMCIEGDRYRFGMFEVVRLPRIRLMRMQ